MAGFTLARQKAILDQEFTSGDYVGWSEDGVNESAYLARTAVGGWTSASDTSPSIKANANDMLSAGCTGSNRTFTHWAVFSAATGGVQKTDWDALDEQRTLPLGAKLSVAAGDLKVTLD